MLGKPQQEPCPTSWSGAWGLSVRDGVLGAKGSSMQKTPGAQSGWERGAPGQEQVRVSPKQGGSPTSPAVSSSSTSPMMNGPSHTCRLSQWDSRGETSWWRSWQGLCEAATRPCTHVYHPQQNFTPSSPSTSDWHRAGKPTSSKPSSGLARLQAVLLCWACRAGGLQGILVQPAPPPPSEAAARFKGRNGVTPTLPILSAPDNRGQHITRVLISLGPEGPLRSQTNLQTGLHPSLSDVGPGSSPQPKSIHRGREGPISRRHCLVHLHTLSWEGLLAGLP